MASGGAPSQTNPTENKSWIQVAEKAQTHFSLHFVKAAETKFSASDESLSLKSKILTNVIAAAAAVGISFIPIVGPALAKPAESTAKEIVQSGAKTLQETKRSKRKLVTEFKLADVGEETTLSSEQKILSSFRKYFLELSVDIFYAYEPLLQRIFRQVEPAKACRFQGLQILAEHAGVACYNEFSKAGRTQDQVYKILCGRQQCESGGKKVKKYLKETSMAGWTRAKVSGLEITTIGGLFFELVDLNLTITVDPVTFFVTAIPAFSSLKSTTNEKTPPSVSSKNYNPYLWFKSSVFSKLTDQLEKSKFQLTRLRRPFPFEWSPELSTSKNLNKIDSLLCNLDHHFGRDLSKIKESVHVQLSSIWDADASSHNQVILDTIENVLAILAKQIEANRADFNELKSGQQQLTRNTDEILEQVKKISLQQSEDPICFIRAASRTPIQSFIGRKDFCTQLQEKAIEAQKSRSFTVVSGLGGVGKTRTILKYWDDDHNFRHKIWIRAEKSRTMREDFNALATVVLGPPPNKVGLNDKELRLRLDQVYRILCTSNSLLVFDNAEKFWPSHLGDSGRDSDDNCENLNHDDAGILRYLPNSHAVTNWPCILVTTRNQDTMDWFYDDVPERQWCLKLASFSTQECVDFVKNRLSGTLDDDDDDESRRQLGALLGGLPLALTQATSHIFQCRLAKPRKNFTIQNYITEYNSQNELVLLQAGVRSNEQTVFTTWNMTLMKILENNDPAIGQLAIDLLDVIAFLAPIDIPVEFLVACYNSAQGSPTASVNEAEPRLFEHCVLALVELDKWSMIDTTDKLDTISVHRLVQQVARLRLRQRGHLDEYLKTIVKNFLFFKDKVVYSTRDSRVLTETEELCAKYIWDHYEATDPLATATDDLVATKFSDFVDWLDHRITVVCKKTKLWYGTLHWSNVKVHGPIYLCAGLQEGVMTWNLFRNTITKTSISIDLVAATSTMNCSLNGPHDTLIDRGSMFQSMERNYHSFMQARLQAIDLMVDGDGGPHLQILFLDGLVTETMTDTLLLVILRNTLYFSTLLILDASTVSSICWGIENICKTFENLEAVPPLEQVPVDSLSEETLRNFHDHLVKRRSLVVFANVDEQDGLTVEQLISQFLPHNHQLSRQVCVLMICKTGRNWGGREREQLRYDAEDYCRLTEGSEIAGILNRWSRSHIVEEDVVQTLERYGDLNSFFVRWTFLTAKYFEEEESGVVGSSWITLCENFYIFFDSLLAPNEFDPIIDISIFKTLYAACTLSYVYLKPTWSEESVNLADTFLSTLLGASFNSGPVSALRKKNEPKDQICTFHIFWENIVEQLLGKPWLSFDLARVKNSFHINFSCASLQDRHNFCTMSLLDTLKHFRGPKEQTMIVPFVLMLMYAVCDFEAVNFEDIEYTYPYHCTFKT